MFKRGDKVICINEKIRKKFNLTESFYLVGSVCSKLESIYSYDLIVIEGERYGYNANYFLTIKEYRKQKLEKICQIQD